MADTHARSTDQALALLLIHEGTGPWQGMAATMKGWAQVDRIDHVHSMAQGRELLRNAAFDAVLVTETLLDRDQPDALRQLQAAGSACARVVLVQKADGACLLRCLGAGADEVLGADRLTTGLVIQTLERAVVRARWRAVGWLPADARVEPVRPADPAPAGRSTEQPAEASLLEALGQAVIVTDPDGVVVLWNAAATRTYGWPATEAVGISVFDLVAAEESASQIAEIMRSTAQGQSWTGDLLVRSRDGSRFPVLITYTPVTDESGVVTTVISVSTDITARKAAEETARAFSAIVESSADAIFTVSTTHRIVAWNAGAVTLYGYPPDAAVGQEVAILSLPGHDDLARVLTTAAQGTTASDLETTQRRRNGSTIDVSLTTSPVYNDGGDVVAVSVIARDISDRKRLEQELARQAMHDSLTGLPNRTLLRDRLAHALLGARDRGGNVAVLFIDLDHFKTINDASGHLSGDELLVEVAARLQRVVRPADTVARFGGDEFVIVCHDAELEAAAAAADRVAAALTAPVEVHGERMYITASIGVALSASLVEATDADALLRYADAAMYDAKAHGRNTWRAFDPSLSERSSQRLELTNELREALAADQLEVHYQPVVDLTSGRIVGLEALTRWNHPVRGNVPPGVFVPLAEESGFVLAFDHWVLTTACRDAVHLREQGLLSDHVRLSVNLSARNLCDPLMVGHVREAVLDAGLPFAMLELEATETAVMTDPGTARQGLEALRELGVEIALDDFGTGYSSLNYLRQLPVTCIKIDRVFVQHILEQPDDLAISVSIVELAKALGLRTTGEGVETREQRALLHKIGCTAGQGFLWSPALPLAALEALLRDHPDGFTSARQEAFRETLSPRATPTNEHGMHRLIQLHREGASAATIAAALNTEGFLTPGGRRWHPSRVTRELGRRVLTASPPSARRELEGVVTEPGIRTPES